jgi:RNA polymerase sigma-70 factor, ECF subfamily
MTGPARLLAAPQKEGLKSVVFHSAAPFFGKRELAPMSEQVETKALLDAAIAGDVAALEQLLLSYFEPLERYLAPRIGDDLRRHFGVEDVLQEVLAQAFRDITNFQHRDDASFFAWLKTIADNRLKDACKHIAAKKRGGDMTRLSNANFNPKSTFTPLIDLVGHDSRVPDDSVGRREAERAIHVALASLPENQRDVLRARYIDDIEVEQIAQQTGRTEAAVRGLIQRGKENLADAMGRASQWLSSH